MNRLATVVQSILILTLGSAVLLSVARADERHEHERHEGYRSRHMVYDDRYGHAHYYPSIGYVVGALPGEAITIGFGGRHLFFHAGVWYEPAPRGYAIVKPPVGVVVPMLPPGYATVPIGGVPYYYANETYYLPGPGGFFVATPPTAYVQAPVAPPVSAPPTMAPPAPAAPAAATWFYCASAKAYYPYVSTCPEGWKSVPATPPSGH